MLLVGYARRRNDDMTSGASFDSLILTSAPEYTRQYGHYSPTDIEGGGPYLIGHLPRQRRCNIKSA